MLTQCVWICCCLSHISLRISGVQISYKIMSMYDGTKESLLLSITNGNKLGYTSVAILPKDVGKLCVVLMKI